MPDADLISQARNALLNSVLIGVKRSVQQLFYRLRRGRPLQYSRKHLLAMVGAARMVRFALVGLLALRFGEGILRWSENPIVQGFLIALIILCTSGTVLSVYGWIHRSRSSHAAHRA